MFYGFLCHKVITEKREKGRKQYYMFASIDSEAFTLVEEKCKGERES